MLEIIEETDTGIYRITSEGKIYSQSKIKIPLVTIGMKHSGKFKHILKPERELTYTLNNRGYHSVSITKKTFMVHRLIAQAFIPNTENKPQVNHKDGNKLNNKLENLEWVTPKENSKHAADMGLKTGVALANSLANLKNKSKLTNDEVQYIRDVYIPRSREFSATALAKQFNVAVSSISCIILRKSYPNVI